MSVGTEPRCFPILPVITIRLETARQKGPRMLLLQRSAELSPGFCPPASLQRQHLCANHTGCRDLGLITSRFMLTASVRTQPSPEENNLPLPQPLGLVPLSRDYYEVASGAWNLPDS